MTPFPFSPTWGYGGCGGHEILLGVGFRAGQARGLDFSSLRPLPSLVIIVVPLASLIFRHLIPMWMLRWPDLVKF